MERITKSGAGFRSLTEQIDTTTAAGRMMMQMVGAFAEFERAMSRSHQVALWMEVSMDEPMSGEEVLGLAR